MSDTTAAPHKDKPRNDGQTGDNRRRDGKGGPRTGKGGRDSKPAAPIRALTSDQVVDRGTTQGETPRAWTIVKRTRQDLNARKVLDVGYVLTLAPTEEGGEAETSQHRSLGEARTAVGKTIVHPQKVTPTKAEAAASKGGKGGKR